MDRSSGLASGRLVGVSELDRKLARARQRAEGLAEAPLVGCCSRSVNEGSSYIGGDDDLAAVVECYNLPEPPIAPCEEPLGATVLALDDQAAVGARDCSTDAASSRLSRPHPSSVGGRKRGCLRDWAGATGLGSFA